MSELRHSERLEAALAGRHRIERKLAGRVFELLIGASCIACFSCRRSAGPGADLGAGLCLQLCRVHLGAQILAQFGDHRFAVIS